MKMTGKYLSLCMLLSISLTGCNTNQEPQQEQVVPVQQEPVTRAVGSGVVHIASEAEFNEKYTKGNVVVDFYAPWCGPCKRLSPMVDAVALEVAHVTFLKVNVDQFGPLARAHGVKAMPTLGFFKDGQRVGLITGWSGSQQDLYNAVLEILPA